MIQFVGLFLACCVPILLYLTMNYWQLDHVRPAVGPLLIYCAVVAPLAGLTQFAVFCVWAKAIQLHAGKVWIIQLIFVAATGAMTLLVTWLWRGELPTRGALVGTILWLVGAGIAAVWR